MPQQKQSTPNLSYRDIQQMKKDSQPINTVTKLVHSFVTHFGTENDKQNIGSEERLYFKILLELFEILGQKISPEENESIKMFIEDKETKEVDDLEKINYIVYEYSPYLPEIVRHFALHLKKFLKLESKTSTFELYEKITNFINEFEKINLKLTQPN